MGVVWICVWVFVDVCTAADTLLGRISEEYGDAKTMLSQSAGIQYYHREEFPVDRAAQRCDSWNFHDSDDFDTLFSNEGLPLGHSLDSFFRFTKVSYSFCNLFGKAVLLYISECVHNNH